MRRVAIVGGGPAGLRAAEVLVESGECAVTVFEGQPSVGRKFLVAGKGGLNLTHSEPLPAFAGRYLGGDWERLLAVFGPDDLRKWAAVLEVETYVGTSGRVFPVGQQAARLLRRWVSKLRGLGVRFAVRQRVTAIGWTGESDSPGSTGGPPNCGRSAAEASINRTIQSPPPECTPVLGEPPKTTGQRPVLHEAVATRSPGVQIRVGEEWQDFDAVILALGGASWPQTGSNGGWPAMLAAHGVGISPWQPANCGWEVDWPTEFRDRFEGQPLKNLAVSVGGRTVRGELLITRYGLEGGALYQLGPSLRAMETPVLTINFKPDSMKPVVLKKLAAPVRWLVESTGEPAREFQLTLRGPRPIAEAISSAGGVRWDELDEMLMLRKLPGVWVCGEMIAWEAPTGGYLLQGCFTTGTVAARGVLQQIGAFVEQGERALKTNGVEPEDGIGTGQ